MIWCNYVNGASYSAYYTSCWSFYTSNFIGMVFQFDFAQTLNVSNKYSKLNHVCMDECLFFFCLLVSVCCLLVVADVLVFVVIIIILFYLFVKLLWYSLFYISMRRFQISFSKIMLRPIDKLSSESFVGVAALLLCFSESEHGKLCASVAPTSMDANQHLNEKFATNRKTKSGRKKEKTIHLKKNRKTKITQKCCFKRINGVFFVSNYLSKFWAEVSKCSKMHRLMPLALFRNALWDAFHRLQHWKSDKPDCLYYIPAILHLPMMDFWI